MSAEVDTLRASLYKVAEQNAKGLPGDVVVRVLKGISEEMYAAGIDSALHMTEKEFDNWDPIASAWDLTWLTLFTVELRKMQVRRRVPFVPPRSKVK